jgi:hypothetical protein
VYPTAKNERWERTGIFGGEQPSPFGLSVSQIFCWTPGVLALVTPDGAPKGRATVAQANGP